jgi:Fe-S cluster assembly protein SufD
MTIQKNKTSKKIMTTLASETIRIQDHAHCIRAGVFLKGWNTRAHLTVILEGAHARFDCFFFIVGNKKETFPFTLSVKHGANNTVSSITMKSILFNESKVDSHGFIRVERGIENANVSFSHHALLCSQNARAILLPVLEIHTNSASARHSASVAHVDTDALWYLMSRGISHKQAYQLLLRGFFEQDAQKISDSSLQRAIQKKLQSLHGIYA